MPKKCTASGDGWACDRTVRITKGLCNTHRVQVARGKPLTEIQLQNRRKRHKPDDMFNDVPAGHQGCTTCGEIKPLEEFSLNRKLKDSRTGRCKLCQANCNLDSEYGVGASIWKPEQLARQGGVCAICKVDDPGPSGWHLDHKHGKKGRDSWRWVLCFSCNSRLLASFENAHDPRSVLTFLNENFERITGEPFG